MDNFFTRTIEENIRVNRALLQLSGDIGKTVDALVSCFRKGGKVITCGNGGSAADAEHFCAELMGRFTMERKPLPCVALSGNTSFVTAWTNDYSFDSLFERQVEALGRENDVLVGISTSGNSENVLSALKKAREKGMETIALLGNGGGKIGKVSKINLIIDSNETPRIQESHILIIHMVCELVEKELFGAK